MIRDKRKLFAGAAVLSVLLCGCSIGGRKIVFTGGLSDRDVFRIGDDTCRLTEAKMYLSNYQNIYGKSYGIDLWEQSFRKQELEKYVKDIVLSEMTKIVCMDQLAKEQKISLTKEERQNIKDAAKKYYQSLNEAELSYTDASEADIVSMYEDYALADKVYRSLTMGVDEEVSDDEARIMEAAQIYVKEKKDADTVAEKLSGQEDFAAVASNFNQKPAIEITFGRGELPQEVEAAAFELDNGEISPCIAVEDGFYFIKCVNKFNEELTDANKANIVAAREKEAFDDVYEVFVRGLSSQLNESVWADITLVTDGTITTDSFFDIIDDAIH